MARISQISWRTFEAGSSAGFAVSQNFILLTEQLCQPTGLDRRRRSLKSTRFQAPSTNIQAPEKSEKRKSKLEGNPKFETSGLYAAPSGFP